MPIEQLRPRLVSDLGIDVPVLDDVPEALRLERERAWRDLVRWFRALRDEEFATWHGTLGLAGLRLAGDKGISDEDVRRAAVWNVLQLRSPTGRAFAAVWLATLRPSREVREGPCSATPIGWRGLALADGTARAALGDELTARLKDVHATPPSKTKALARRLGALLDLAETVGRGEASPVIPAQRELERPRRILWVDEDDEGLLLNGRPVLDERKKRVTRRRAEVRALLDLADGGTPHVTGRQARFISPLLRPLGFMVARDKGPLSVGGGEVRRGRPPARP
jgi:hypothetical protein